MANEELILKELLAIREDIGSLKTEVRKSNGVKLMIEHNAKDIGVNSSNIAKLTDKLINCTSMMNEHFAVENGLKEYIDKLVNKRRWIATFISSLVGTLLGFGIGIYLKIKGE